MADFKPAWTIFSHGKLRLNGDAWEKGGKDRPSLLYKVHNNNPRFSLYMNEPGKRSKPIPFALSPFIAQQIFKGLERIVANPDADRIGWELKGYYDHHGQKSDKPEVIGKISVGRDSEGVVYIALQGKGESAAKFNFQPDYFALLTDASGETLPSRAASEVCALAWAQMLSDLTGTFMVSHGKEPAEKPGSGGGYNKGGNSSPASKPSWDDDAPF